MTEGRVMYRESTVNGRRNSYTRIQKQRVNLYNYCTSARSSKPTSKETSN